MSQPFPDDPFLQGNYAPWPMEGEIHDLVVEGAIPRELHGALYRNGPNPQFAPRGKYHWFTVTVQQSVKLPHRIPYGFHGNWGPGIE